MKVAIVPLKAIAAAPHCRLDPAFWTQIAERLGEEKRDMTPANVRWAIDSLLDEARRKLEAASDLRKQAHLLLEEARMLEVRKTHQQTGKLSRLS